MSISVLSKIFSPYRHLKYSYQRRLYSPAVQPDYETQAILQQSFNKATLSDDYQSAPGFGFGNCPQRINCVLNSSTEANKAGLSAGVSIVAVISTMLALIGNFSRSLAVVSSIVSSALCGFYRR